MLSKRDQTKFQDIHFAVVPLALDGVEMQIGSNMST